MPSYAYNSITVKANNADEILGTIEAHFNGALLGFEIKTDPQNGEKCASFCSRWDPVCLSSLSLNYPEALLKIEYFAEMDHGTGYAIYQRGRILEYRESGISFYEDIAADQRELYDALGEIGITSTDPSQN